MIGLNRLSTKSKLQLMLLFVSLSSILVVGYLGWSWARTAMKEQIFNQLTSVRASKVYQIESYFKNLRNHVETLAEDRMVVEAMVQFNQSFKELDKQSIPPEWETAIAQCYQQEIFPKLSKVISGSPDVEIYRPYSRPAQYLQYHYLAKNPNPIGKKDALVNATDNSIYSKVHARYHQLFRNLTQRFSYNDLFLIDAKTKDIVYTVYKEIDFGANLGASVLAKSNLAALVEEVQKNPDRGSIRLVDFQSYRPSYMAPAAFIASPIYNGATLVGILAIQLPVDEINNVVTGNKNWKRDGLGNTGETYIVGSDLLMRSTSRFLIEDPQGYKATLKSIGMPETEMRLVEQLGTSTLLQKINTQAVQEAISNKSGIQILKDYRGRTVLSSYSPLKVEGVNWAIISEMDIAEAYQPIYALQRDFLIATVILALAVALLAGIAAHRFVRPFTAMINRARKANLNDTPNEAMEFAALLNTQDEPGELARLVDDFAQSANQHETALEQKNQEVNQLLLNSLPAPIVERVNRGETQIADQVQQVTILIATLVGINTLSTHRDVAESAKLFNQVITSLDDLADRFDVEKFRTMGDRYSAVCGLSKPRLDHSKRMVDFALQAIEALQIISDREKIPLRFAAGIHTGELSAGIIGSKKFAYELWGDTWEIVSQLHTHAEPHTLRVSEAIYERVHNLYSFEKATPIQLGDRRQLPTWVLRKGGLRDLIDNLSLGLDLDDWDTEDSSPQADEIEPTDSMPTS